MKQTDYQQQQHGGIVLDLPPEEVAPNQWTGGENIQFRDDCSQVVEGYAKFAPPLGAPAPIFAFSVPTETQNFWVYMTETQVWVTDGFNHNNITPAGGLSPTTAGAWTGCMLNGIPVFNNPQNKPFFWNLNPAVVCSYLPGWPATAFCQSMRAIKYHLVALNITEASVNQPHSLWWSEGAQAGAIPPSWVPTAANDAGDAILADSVGRIIDAAPLGDSLIIYKTNATYLMQYVAGQYVYAVRKIFPSIGIAARHCVAEINGEHWVFTGQDVVRHDGQNYVSVVQDKVKRALVNSIDPSQIQLCCVLPRVVDQQVWVCIPVSGRQRLTQAYVLNANNEQIGVRDLPSVSSVNRGVVMPQDVLGSWNTNPFTWATVDGQWNQARWSPTADSLLMTGTSQNQLYTVGTGTTADGVNIFAYVERLSLLVGDPVSHKLYSRLVPRIDGPMGESVTIRLGTQDYFEEPIVWHEPLTYVIGSQRDVEQIIQGRFISVRFEGQTSSPWRLYSYKLKLADLGEF